MAYVQFYFIFIFFKEGDCENQTNLRNEEYIQMRIYNNRKIDLLLALQTKLLLLVIMSAKIIILISSCCVASYALKFNCEKEIAVLLLLLCILVKNSYNIFVLRLAQHCRITS